jgi:phosphoadenylyl-sulfate reductase (thioredoxin)
MEGATSREDLEAQAHELSAIHDPQALVAEVLTRFGAAAAIGTSGQLSGVTLIDLAWRTQLPFRVFVVDTLRLHASTYALWDELEVRYGISLERYGPDPAAVQRMVQRHGEYLFFDSKAKQEYCCDVRKVEPNKRALASVTAWLTGLRRDQSESRKTTPRCEVSEQDGRLILKVAPLVDFDEEKTWAYIRERSVPYDRIFDERADGSRYPSVGCVICTTPILPWEEPRAGRWRWFNSLGGDNKECGIHSR